MIQPVVDHLFHHHDLPLVAAALAVCVFTALSVFWVLDHSGDKRAVLNRWIALAGLVSGVGIWATHFIAMLAYHGPVPVRYDLTQTLASVIVAIVITTLGWAVAHRNRGIGPLIGGGIVGGGIAAMHYIGMSALRLPGWIEWRSDLVLVSVAVSIALGALAAREHCRRTTLVPWRAGLALTAAILGLHFIGMGAMRVIPDPLLHPTGKLIDDNLLAALVIVGSTMIIGVGFLVVLFDRLKERERAAARIAHLAYYDALTGLSNRRMFVRHLEASVARATRADGTLAIISVDLDGFKAVNDTRGHPVGDQLLVEVSERLRAVTRRNEMVARTGGDEFVIVQEGGSQPAHSALVAERVVEALSRPYSLAGHTIRIGASVGVSLFPQNALTAVDLAKTADVALYEAKSAGRGVMRYYETSMDHAQRDRIQLEADLDAAMRAEELELHYQPIAAVPGGDIIGFEALVRWTHPQLGPIEPELFVRIAEDSGAIVELGRWVLRQACTTAAGWSNRLTIAVNLSPIQFNQKNFVGSIVQILQETGLDPRRLELEVTERVLIADEDKAFRVLEELRAWGIGISLDDFGMGYSSFAYFRRFPFTTVKIDRSFVSEMDQNPAAREIVRSVIDLGRRLGMTVLAEGVETADQLARLSALRCKAVQGYLIGRPQPIAHYAHIVRGPVKALSDAA